MPSRFSFPRLLPRKRVWLLAAACLLGPLLLLSLAVLFRVQVELDVAAVLRALALGFAALTLYLVVRHRMQPRQTVSIGYRVRFEEPLVPLVGRYTFRLEVYYELEEKGQRSRVDQGTIELTFRRRDGADLHAWCSAHVAEHLELHRDHALVRYPGARVLLPAEPSPRELSGLSGERVPGGLVLAAE